MTLIPSVLLVLVFFYCLRKILQEDYIASEWPINNQHLSRSLTRLFVCVRDTERYQNVHTREGIVMMNRTSVWHLHESSKHGDVKSGRGHWKRHARFLAGLGSKWVDRGWVSEQGAGTQVSVSQTGNTAHDHVCSDLHHRNFRQCRHVHGHHPKFVHADRHQLLSL